MDSNNEVGKRLRYLRDKCGLSQKELGDALAVRQSTISEIENGNNQPSIAMLIRLAKYFGVQPGYFVDSVVEQTNDEKVPAIAH